MENYQPRKIRFKELVQLNNWQIKVYTIAKTGEFENDAFYGNVLKRLPEWLNSHNGFDSSNDRIAFLILHAGTEGIFSLINWWVGRNMLNTQIFITYADKPEQFEKISGEGLAPCVWELEIINHERVSWTTHVLKKNTADYGIYLKDTTNVEI